jgi:lactate permease
VLFYLLVVRRVAAQWSAAGGAAAALVVAVVVYRMPASTAGMAFLNGALFALMPICWTIAAAMYLYNLTVETGCFTQIRNSVAGISPDHRLQAILIAFAFGAFLEGAAGGGTPVAICAAMLVGLGFDAFLAAGVCLIANTSPVAYGGFGTPILTLQSVTGIDGAVLSRMAGNQLPILSCIVPLWLVRCMCGWKETREVLPAIAVAGGSFAVIQYLFAHSGAWPLTDLVGGLLCLLITAVFLHRWKPKTVWRVKLPNSANIEERLEHAHLNVAPMKPSEVAGAWMPFAILCVIMAVVGTWKKPIDSAKIGPVQTTYEWHIPALDRRVERRPPVVEAPVLEPAVFRFNWFTMPGTSIALTSLLVLAILRPSKEVRRTVLRRTVEQMAIPVPCIVFMLGLGYTTRFGGMDATLGMSFKSTGMLYPFFAAILGWLGVFLTGTDAASNALFGSLQKITAMQLGLNPILICTANSTGGVMGKMIDAQSICVATAATETVGTEADVFKFVVKHSIALASIVGIIIMLQAYVPPFTWMVPQH